MKKLIFVLTLLLLVSPALAKVNVYCTTEGKEVSVYYSMDGSDANKPVAFGLDIEVDSSATIGVPNNVDPNFWVYPGTIDINTEADPPEVNEAGTPYADPCDYPSDTKGGPGTGAMTVEMGALFSPPEANSPNAPNASGLLFKFTVDVNDCNVSIAENSIRGGVVLVGGEASDPNLTGCVVAAAPPDCFNSGHADYSEWQTVGEPDCWCYTYQCDGDVDGLELGDPKVGLFHVEYQDLTAVLGSWKQASGYDICADVSRSEDGDPKVGLFRVEYQDLTIVLNNWKKPTGELGGNCGGTSSP